MVQTETHVASDEALRQAVLRELDWEPSVDARRIGVAVLDAVVTLAGEARSFAEKWSAERAAERVKGVRGIANEIEVKPLGERSDQDLARAAVEALGGNTLVPADRITVKVDHGWLTLKGEVEYDYQRRGAERAIRYLPGVRGVSNLITVKPSAVPDHIKEKIEETFKRRAILDARNIQVTVQNGKVTLRGTVRSWAERTEAERAAWGAPGVSEVDNRIVVSPPD